MEEKTGFGYYAVIPMKLLLDEEINPKARLLFGVIANLANQRGYCFATNAYLAKITGWHKGTISEFVNQLIDNKYVSVETETNQYGTQRRLFIDEAPIVKPRRGGASNDEQGVRQTANHNSIRRINKENKQIDDPLPFPSLEFQQAWGKWRTHRHEIRKKLTPSTTHAQFKKLIQLSGNNEAEAIRIIEQSITNGWTGLFEVKDQGKTQGKLSNGFVQ